MNSSGVSTVLYKIGNINTYNLNVFQSEKEVYFGRVLRRARKIFWRERRAELIFGVHKVMLVFTKKVLACINKSRYACQLTLGCMNGLLA